jgi:HEAT repeat protein
MGIFRKLFSAESGPSEGQVRRALKQVIQPHGDASTRVGAMERLAAWKTPEAAAALLRRFTIQVPQASMDLEEKQYATRLLVQMGRAPVEPILRFLRTESEVTWPVRALRDILPPDAYRAEIRKVLDELGGGYTRWPEAKTVLINHVPDDAYPEMRDIVIKMLKDEDDDVCIAAAEYLARNGEEQGRETMIETYLEADGRPRVRGRILDLFCEREWPVKGYRKRVEEAIAEPFYLTAKGTVKRRPQ